MWRAVDAGGDVLGAPRPSPALAMRSAPVVSWPLAVEHDDGRRLSFAAAVGPGGERVAELFDGPVVDVERLVHQTPAGTVELPLDRVDVAVGVEAAAAVDLSWLAEVERRRARAREDVVANGRGDALEAALHVVLLVATAGVHDDVGARIASGARLWLLGGAVASALGGEPDPFHPWGRLVAAGWWPIGPSGGRLVVA